jgi:heme/copper-type cytochrome/quinol oxidase subunit 2
VKLQVLSIWENNNIRLKGDATFFYKKGWLRQLNQVSFVAERSGIYYGQCSEICRVWHGFMPIVVEAVPSPD